MAGKPVIKKARKKSEKMPGQTAPIPTVSHQAAATQQIESKDKTYIRMPGDVVSPIRMRISDAKNRRIISLEVFQEFLKLRTNAMEDISFVDTVTIVPLKDFQEISGISQKPTVEVKPRIKQKLDFNPEVKNKE